MKNDYQKNDSTVIWMKDIVEVPVSYYIVTWPVKTSIFPQNGEYRTIKFTVIETIFSSVYYANKHHVKSFIDSYLDLVDCSNHLLACLTQDSKVEDIDLSNNYHVKSFIDSYLDLVDCSNHLLACLIQDSKVEDIDLPNNYHVKNFIDSYLDLVNCSNHLLACLTQDSKVEDIDLPNNFTKVENYNLSVVEISYKSFVNYFTQTDPKINWFAFNYSLNDVISGYTVPTILKCIGYSALKLYDMIMYEMDAEYILVGSNEVNNDIGHVENLAKEFIVGNYEDGAEIFNNYL